jgi:hypothetical protein
MTQEFVMTDRKDTQMVEGIVPAGLAQDGVKIAPPEMELELDDALGLQMISIRLPKKLIEDLKLIAKKEGLGYQPLMRRVLLRFAEQEFRSWAHDDARLVATAVDVVPAEQGLKSACG